MQDLDDVNGWLQEQMNAKVSIDTEVFEEIISKISYRQHLVELYIRQKVFTEDQIKHEQAMNEVLYRWVYALRDQIQKKLIDMQKSKEGNAAYKDVKLKNKLS